MVLKALATAIDGMMTALALKGGMTGNHELSAWVEDTKRVYAKTWSIVELTVAGLVSPTQDATDRLSELFSVIEAKRNDGSDLPKVGDRVYWRSCNQTFTGLVGKVGTFLNKPAVWVHLGEMTTVDGQPAGKMVEIVDIDQLTSKG